MILLYKFHRNYIHNRNGELRKREKGDYFILAN